MVIIRNRIMNTTTQYKTSDLALAAFLVMRGLPLISATRVSGKFEFVFDDPGQKGHMLSIDFVNSDFSKFDNHVRTLKKILYKS